MGVVPRCYDAENFGPVVRVPQPLGIALMSDTNNLNAEYLWGESEDEIDCAFVFPQAY